MSYHQVKCAVITISGFSQKVSKATGMGHLYWAIRTEHARTPTHTFEHLPWSANFKQEAAKIKLHAAHDIRIIVIAYSWGCGRGVRQLAKHLGKLGLEIELVILIDPVLYRPGLGISYRLFWALSRSGSFRVPVNILNVVDFRQVNERPVGRKLKILGSKTNHLAELVFGSRAKLDRYGNQNVEPFAQIVNSKIGHADMDENTIIHRMVVDRIRSMMHTMRE